MPILNYIATRTLLAKNIQERIDSNMEESSSATAINVITSSAYSVLTEYYTNEILIDFEVETKLLVQNDKPIKYQIEVDVKYSSGMIDSFILYTDYVNDYEIAYDRAMSGL